MKIINGQKYIWRCASIDNQIALDIAIKYNVSLPIAHTILARGYLTDKEINSYIFTSELEVSHPSQLKDASKAVDRIIQAIQNKEKILVAGDYDVDGITSSSLMMICLVPLGANINFFLPHRVKDGYGLSTKVVERAAANGYKLIVTVDNGITAFEPAQRAKELGVDLIITDHHRPHDAIPDAFAVINPNQEDCPYPYKKFAGVGVIFKLITLLYEKMGVAQLPSKAYELLLLGTVADVVPLTGENRYWVRHGLRYINSNESSSLKVLKDNSKVVKPKLSSVDIGFSITPQINALGRLEDPRQGVKFLIGSDLAEVQQVGKVLYELNEARKAIERSIFEEVQSHIESGKIDLKNENIIMAASRNWPPGVIGLVASRLVSAYGKPTLLFHLTDSGIAKGSCRSIPAFNMFNALADAKDMLNSFGGHSIAAGLALPQNKLPQLKEHLEKLVSEQLTPFDLQQKILIDAEIKLVDVNSKLLHDLNYLEPFGNENPQPLFYVDKVTMVQQPKLLKDAHVKCSIFLDGIIKPVIFFNRPDLYEQLIAQGDNPFSIAVQISENYWNDRVNIELIGLDVAFKMDSK